MKKRLVLSPLTNKRSGNYMFLLCFTFYFILYLGRYNYAAALAEITTTGVLEKDAAGLVSTALSITYGCGQLINGFISDRVPPFGLVSIGFLISGIMNIGMYFASSAGLGLGVYIVIWGMNGYAQSVVWPTMIRIVANILPEEQRVSAGVSMLATTAVGTVLSYLLSSLTMKVSGWQECFLVPGIILISAAVIWFAATRPISRISVGYTDAVLASKKTEKKDKTDKNSQPLLPLLITSGALLMLIPISMMSIIKDGITTWTPTIITETFSAKPEVATLMTTIIPLISIFGAVIAKFVMDKWLHDELKSSVFMFVSAGAGLAMIITFGSENLIFMLIMLALIIAFMLGINTMFISLVPLRFGKYGKSATVTGILNSTASISCGISTFLVGLLAKHSGWNTVYVVFFVLVSIGAVVTLLIVKHWMIFKRN